MAGYNRLEAALWAMCAAMRTHLEHHPDEPIDEIVLSLGVTTLKKDGTTGRHGVKHAMSGEAAEDDYLQLAVIGDDASLPPMYPGMKPSERLDAIDKVVDDAEYERRRP